MMSEISSLAPQQFPSSIDLTTADLAGPSDPSQSLRHNPWRPYEESQLGSLWLGLFPRWCFRLAWWLSPVRARVMMANRPATAAHSAVAPILHVRRKPARIAALTHPTRRRARDLRHPHTLRTPPTTYRATIRNTT